MTEDVKKTCPFCKGKGVLSGLDEAQAKELIESVNNATIHIAVKAALESMGLLNPKGAAPVPVPVPGPENLQCVYRLSENDLLGCRRVKTIKEAASMVRVLQQSGNANYRIEQVAEFDNSLLLVVRFSCLEDAQKGINFFGVRLEPVEDIQEGGV